MSGDRVCGFELTPVTSADDSRLAEYTALKSRSAGRQSDEPYFVVEGRLLVERLIASNFEIRSILIQQGRDPAKIGPIPPGTPVYEVPSEAISMIAGFDFHRGYLASATRRPLQGLTDFQDDPLSLGLIQINDMENAGSMLRTAAAFGIRQVLVDRQSVDVYARRVLRVSMGAAFGMRFVQLRHARRDLDTLAAGGVATLAATLSEDSKSVEALRIGTGQPAVLLVGNEARGLPRSVQDSVTERVKIAMRPPHESEPMVDSLNVSVAAGILMYELTKRCSP